MQIKYIEIYDKHGCKFTGKLGFIDYSKAVTNHSFGGAYNSGGLFEKLEDAKRIMNQAHPDAVVLLGIPDLVFRYEQ